MFLGPALYPLEDPHEWAERYTLEIMEIPCMSCQAPLLLKIPFAMKGGVRGLTTEQCKECGETRTPFVYTLTQ